MPENGFLDVTDQDFEKEVLREDIPIMLIFWAKWCGPCRALNAAVGKLIPDFMDKIKFIRVNTDDSKLQDKYNVQAIPSFVFIKNGKVVDLVDKKSKKKKVFVGFMDADIVEEKLKQLVGISEKIR